MARKSESYFQVDEILRDVVSNLDRAERAELVQEIADELGVTKRTAQRYISSADERRAIPSEVIPIIINKLPEPTFNVSLSGQICISNDCRERTITAEFDADEFAEFNEKLHGGNVRGAQELIAEVYGINPAGIPTDKPLSVSNAKYNVRAE